MAVIFRNCFERLIDFGRNTLVGRRAIKQVINSSRRQIITRLKYRFLSRQGLAELYIYIAFNFLVKAYNDTAGMMEQSRMCSYVQRIQK